MTFAQPFQDYEILDRVGAGAMGTVFKARHKKLSRIVALKVLKPSLARDSRYVERLRREARIVASLNHRHIVTGYDLGEEGGYHFFVMEFVEGKSLRALLTEWGMFAEEYVLEVAVQISEALDHAYQCSVIHRDIKPGNILIDEAGDAKLTDMGLAKGPADLTLTRDGATVGTPQYISPEQARNPQDVDVRTDLYSLGATLYHMATGVPPFTGDTMAELIGKVIYDPPVPPDELNPALSSGLSLVLRKLLAKDLRVRYQTPRELLDDLHRIQKALPPQVDAARLAAGEGERRSRLPQRFGITLAAVAGLALATWFGMQLRDDPTKEAPADPYLQRLDATLAKMSTPGARWMHLGALMQEPPPGLGRELVQRHKSTFNELQAAVDAAAAEFTGEAWARFTEWVNSPIEWPDRARCDQERVEKTLNAATGMLSSEFPSTLNKARLSGLSRAIDALLAQRDVALLSRLDVFLANTLADHAEVQLLANNFSGAAKVWREALMRFCGQIDEPDLELLAESTQRAARLRCDQARQVILPQIASKEKAVADAMRREVQAVVSHHAERLATGADPADVAVAVAAYRQELLQFYPASARFHAEYDPWHESQSLLRSLQQRVRLAEARQARDRFEHRCAFAWRALCYGDVADAEAALADVVAPTEELAGKLEQHRAALRSALLVRDRLLTALAGASQPVFAFPRTGSGLGVPLFVDDESGRHALFVQNGQVPRPARLTEFRFGELLEAVRKAVGREPLDGLAAADRSRGELVLRLVGDDLTAIDALLRATEAGFLVEEVWPILKRVRGQQGEVALDRTGLLAALREQLRRARAGGDLHELQRAIRSFESRVALSGRSNEERKELRAAKAYDRLAHRRAQVRSQITGEAPQGAVIEVGIDEDHQQVTAVVAARAPQLLSNAAGGWEMRLDREVGAEVLEYAGGDRLWSELEQSRLRFDTGMPTRGHTTLQLDFLVPAATVGRRFYVVEFRGIAVMLVFTADNAVHAALVDGDVHSEAVADKAFGRAISGVFDAVRAVAVADVVHRLTIDVWPSSSGARASVKVLFEGRDLLPKGHGQCPLDAEAPVSLTLFPRQELRVLRVQVNGRGL